MQTTYDAVLRPSTSCYISYDYCPRFLGLSFLAGTAGSMQSTTSSSAASPETHSRITRLLVFMGRLCSPQFSPGPHDISSPVSARETRYMGVDMEKPLRPDLLLIYLEAL